MMLGAPVNNTHLKLSTVKGITTLECQINPPGATRLEYRFINITYMYLGVYEDHRLLYRCLQNVKNHVNFYYNSSNNREEKTPLVFGNTGNRKVLLDK